MHSGSLSPYSNSVHNSPTDADKRGLPSHVHGGGSDPTLFYAQYPFQPPAGLSSHPVLRGNASTSILWWSPEVAWCCISIACVIAIITILHVYDDQQSPDWRFGITLNTLIAFLSSISKLAFLIPVLEGLGQLKWLWFTSRHRALEDFELFDQATRGGLGCIKLLCRLKGPLGCIGAFIVISSFFTSTLTQLMVSYYPGLSEYPESFNATAPRSTVLSKWNGTDLSVGGDDTLIFTQALVSSAYLPTTQPATPTAPNCTTGNCKWYPFGSLAVCSRVEYLSPVDNATLRDSIERNTMEQLRGLYDSATTMTKSRGHKHRRANHTHNEDKMLWPLQIIELDSPSGVFDSSVTDLAISDMLVAFPGDYLNITQITNANDTSQLDGFHYFELLFHWCIAEFSTRVTDGVATTNQTSNSTTIIARNNTDSLNNAWSNAVSNCVSADAPHCDINVSRGSVVLAPPDTVSAWEKPLRYVLDVNTALAVSSYMSYHLGGGILNRQEGLRPSFEQGILAYPLAAFLGGRPDAMAFDDQYQTVRAVGANIATGLTNMLRMMGDTGQDPGGPSLGCVFAHEQFVRIHWAWVSLITTQILLASAFLTTVIWTTRRARVQILKSATLPIMLALNPQAQRDMSGVLEVQTLADRARGVRVQLERGGGGVGLWLGLAHSNTGARAENLRGGCC